MREAYEAQREETPRSEEFDLKVRIPKAQAVTRAEGWGLVAWAGSSFTAAMVAYLTGAPLLPLLGLAFAFALSVGLVMYAVTIELYVHREWHWFNEGEGEADERLHLELEVKGPNRASSWAIVDLIADWDLMGEFLYAGLRGDSMTEAAWIRRWPGPNRKENFVHDREEMLRAKVIQWVNPQAHAQGLKLTDKGKALVEQHFPAPAGEAAKTAP